MSKDNLLYEGPPKGGLSFVIFFSFAIEKEENL